MSGNEAPQAKTSHLAGLLETAGLNPIDDRTLAKFEEYLNLLLRWNARTNLTAIRDPNEIMARHFVESIACAQALPAGIATLLDFGSGAGFPGIPIALCRPEILVTLGESQNKKAAFLREALRGLDLRSRVFMGRAETLSEHFDCVTLRAVDRMQRAIAMACGLVDVAGWLAVFTTEESLPSLKFAEDVEVTRTVRLAGSDEGLIVFAQKNKTPELAVPEG